jgi:hypothetical protein
MAIGTGSHLVEFSYPRADGRRTLQVFSGLDEIEWGYTLNVARYPTYLGEVVQILSCFVEDISIEGSLQKVNHLEQLYTFFLEYISQASQGQGNGPTYSQEPITMLYPHRGWTFYIIPTGLLGFNIGRDIVAQKWRIQAHVNDHENTDDLTDLIITEAQMKSALNSDDPSFDASFEIKGEIRFVGRNPFSDPQASVAGTFDTELHKRATELSDFYTSLLPSYLQGDFDALLGNQASVPAFVRQAAQQKKATP